MNHNIGFADGKNFGFQKLLFHSSEAERWLCCAPSTGSSVIREGQFRFSMKMWSCDKVSWNKKIPLAVNALNINI
jgi:hypothetical protein